MGLMIIMLHVLAIYLLGVAFFCVLFFDPSRPLVDPDVDAEHRRHLLPMAEQ